MLRTRDIKFGWTVAWTAFASGGFGLASAAPAQSHWVPASEILNQPVEVRTNGVTNRLILSPGGHLSIYSPSGARLVNGAWTAANGQLCLTKGGPQECWPYTAPFQAGQPVTMTSSCNAVATWVAEATNAPSAPPLLQPAAPPESAGKRGL